MPRVVHFEIHADDLQRARDFYTKVLDWKITKWDGPVDYWMIVTGKEGEPGINGGLIKRAGTMPPQESAQTSYVCTVEVDDIDKYIAKVKEHGGGMALDKMPIPKVGWVAYCTDTEGNVFGFMQPDENAA
jgi:uncharacterized protein